MDSGNHFQVRRTTMDEIAFSIFQDIDGKRWELRAQLDPALALNLAAWLALVADPPGEEFCRLYNEIKKS
jgi:Iap family predicted aminopeptidase